MEKLKRQFTKTPTLNPNLGGLHRTTFKLAKNLLGHQGSYYSTENVINIYSGYGKLYFSPTNGNVNNPENLEYFKELLIK